MKVDDLQGRIIDTIAAVTRYPKTLLEPTADLENDLGIDSVKLVEILVALDKEFQLELVKAERDPKIRTIEQLATWVEERLGQPQAASNGVPTHQGRSLQAAVHGQPTRIAEDKPTVKPRTPAEQAAGQDVGDEVPQTEPIMSDPVASGHAVPRPKAAASFAASQRNGQADDQRRPINGHSQPLNGHSQPTPSEMPVKPPAMAQSEMGPLGKTLHGRVALVTGSGRGVGRTIARLLANRGAVVIVNSFHSRELGEQTAAEINARGGQAIHLWGSVANPEHVDAIFDEIEQRFGCLDILVCNASDGRLGSFLEVTPEDWERAFRTNVVGHHHCAERASRLMQRRGGGAIVTMSSIAASRYVEGLGGQGVVKAAVESLTRHLACELAPWGIRANCVCGGPVYGQVMNQYPEARATLNYWETLVLDGELCSPLDLAQTVAFLVSDEARGVNGAVWNVDHGLATRSHSRPLPRSQSQRPGNDQDAADRELTDDRPNDRQRLPNLQAAHFSAQSQPTQ